MKLFKWGVWDGGSPPPSLYITPLPHGGAAHVRAHVFINFPISLGGVKRRRRHCRVLELSPWKEASTEKSTNIGLLVCGSYVIWFLGEKGHMWELHKVTVWVVLHTWNFFLVLCRRKSCTFGIHGLRKIRFDTTLFYTNFQIFIRDKWLKFWRFSIVYFHIEKKS